MFEMSEDLFYCTAWPHRKRSIYGQEYELCVSNAILGNATGSILQFHVLLKVNGNVATLNQICDKGIDSLHVLENRIKSVCQSVFAFFECIEKNNVKIWYYPMPGTQLNLANPHFRLAITLANVKSDPESQSRFQQEIENLIWYWVQERQGAVL